MQLVIACVLITGFDLPTFWYWIAGAVWVAGWVYRLVEWLKH